MPDLEIAHEQPMHLVIVSADLARFAHVHPIAEGGGFTIVNTFEAGGDYVLFADYQQPGRGPIVDRHRLHVDGTPPRAQPLVESPRTQEVNGLQVTLRTEGELRAGHAALLQFDAVAAATGLPATDLEPYLGARAHLLVLGADAEELVHVHALEDASTASRVSAHAMFPRPGLYKLWAQLKRQGTVVTIPFVLRVGATNGEVEHAPRAGAAAGHEHSQH